MIMIKNNNYDRNNDNNDNNNDDNNNYDKKNDCNVEKRSAVHKLFNLIYRGNRWVQQNVTRGGKVHGMNKIYLKRLEFIIHFLKLVLYDDICYMVLTNYTKVIIINYDYLEVD